MRGHGDHVAERRRVARGDRAPAVELLVEDLELGQENCRLKRVEAAGETEHERLVAGAGAAVRADHADRLGELAALGEHRTAVAVAAERLGRIETGRADIGASAPTRVAADGAAKTLRSIGEHVQAMPLGDGGDRRVVRRQPVEIDGHHRARPQRRRRSGSRQSRARDRRGPG